jgi:hypothetical protein
LAKAVEDQICGLPALYPKHVLSVTTAQQLQKLQDTGRLLDEAAAIAPHPSTSSKKPGDDQVPRIDLKVPALFPQLTKAKAAPKKAAKKEEWTCENDGNVHPWEYKGKRYARNFDNQVWLVDSSGEVCGWAGVWDGKKLDASAEEPVYMDEEDEE